MTDARTVGTFAVCLAILGVLAYAYFVPFDLGLPSLVPNLLQRQITPLSRFDDLPGIVSGFLWGNRSIDLIGQSFVILASVVCCLALLKMEGDSE